MIRLCIEIGNLRGVPYSTHAFSQSLNPLIPGQLWGSHQAPCVAAFRMHGAGNPNDQRDGGERGQYRDHGLEGVVLPNGDLIDFLQRNHSLVSPYEPDQ